MRPIEPVMAAALDGSRPADTLTVWAWRDGVLVLPEPLEVLEWSATDKAGDSVKINQTLSLRIADPDGTLGAWLFDDPLGVAGTQLQVLYNVGSAGTLNFAWFRLTDNQPEESIDWRVIDEYRYDEPDSDLAPHQRKVPVVTATVQLEAADLTLGPDRDKLEAPESPSAGATAVSEWTRLTQEYFPTVVDEGVVDVAVPRLLVFDEERLEAGQDLLDRISARYRMGGDGECHIYPRATAPVWRVEPGKALVAVSRQQSIDGLYNKWIVEGKDEANGNPVRAEITIDGGPLRYGGPHGKSQYKYSSEMIVTRDQAHAYALELRAKFLASLAVELVVRTAPRPELQAGDRIEVGYPLAAGHVAYFPGQVTSIQRGGNPLPGLTTLNVSCSYQDVSTALRRTAWAEHRNGGLPELTWDKMPTRWGATPDAPWDEL